MCVCVRVCFIYVCWPTRITSTAQTTRRIVRSRNVTHAPFSPECCALVRRWLQSRRSGAVEHNRTAPQPQCIPLSTVRRVASDLETFFTAGIVIVFNQFNWEWFLCIYIWSARAQTTAASNSVHCIIVPSSTRLASQSPSRKASRGARTNSIISE